MSRPAHRVLAVAFLLSGVCRASLAQTGPVPSYAFAVQTVATGGCERPRINNHGEIVYTRRTGDIYQVWSSARGLVSQGTTDRDPDINEGGEIIWRFGEGGAEQNGIASSSRGILYTSNGQNPYYDSQRINDEGEIVCSIGDRIYSLTRGFLTTPPTGNDRDPVINNAGEVAYRAYRWTAPAFHIVSTVQGLLASEDSSYLFYPDINDTGEVVWVYNTTVVSSVRGVLRTATNLSQRAAVNNGGEVVWIENNQVFSSTRGQLTFDPVRKSRPHINDRGDIVWLNGDGSIGLAAWRPIPPRALPPRTIAPKSFTARWEWVDGGAPVGVLSVCRDAAFTQPVPGFGQLVVANGTECLVTNLQDNTDYWYRVRRLVPDGQSDWSARIRVRTGKGLPVFRNLPAGGPVGKGIVQEIVLTNLVAGAGSLKVRSSNPEAVAAGLSDGLLTLHYLWKGAPTATVTMTFTHPGTGYKTACTAGFRRAGGNVIVAETSALTNAGAGVAQEVTLVNGTTGTLFGIRVGPRGLDDPAWLVNRTGFDPATGEPILELPCWLPAGSGLTVRLVYRIDYKRQARTRPVQYGAWAVMTPFNGRSPVMVAEAPRQERFEGKWMAALPALPNRPYMVQYSDDGGTDWFANGPAVRATATVLMWLDLADDAPGTRLYRAVEETPAR